MAVRGLFRILLRKKIIEPVVDASGQLRRCLNVWQLITIGLGSTLGATTYVLIGQVALETAGPSIVISFLIAATGSTLAGLCYAELGSRMPRAGSVYDYAYTAVGELYAFIVSWTSTFEYLCGTAYVARSLSTYVDSLSDGQMQAFFREVAPIPGELLGGYFDFMAFSVVIIMGLLIAMGVRLSTSVHAFLTTVNFLVIMFVIIAGSFKANPENWQLTKSDVPEGYGTGGFFPYGVRGMFDGAAICFFGFVGFESTTFATEEVKNAKRNLPIALIVTLATICALFCGVSIVQTMMLPYYLLDKKAAMAQTFVSIGWDWARYMVMPGAVCGMSASMFGAMMPLPRLWMAMARDGLLFKFLSKVNQRTRTPFIATLITTSMSAIMTALLELDQLDKMLVVGTLMSYNAVAVCVLLMRYQYEQDVNLAKVTIQKLIQAFKEKHPSIYTEVWANSCLIFFILTVFVCGMAWTHFHVSYIIIGILHGVMVVQVLIMFMQPQRDKSQDVKHFRTPLVPFVPCLGLYVNINLMILVEASTYIRTTAWFCIGIPVYIICLFLYKKHKITDENANSFRSSYSNKPFTSSLPEIKAADNKNANKNSSNTDKKKKRMNDGKDKTTEQDTPALGRNNKVIIIQQAIVESNEEKEAKIIDLLDQVLQAEEDSYDDMVILQEKIVENVLPLNETHRKSLGEQSDTGSDVSINNQVLSKYNVVAQVHREDLPKVCEEDELNKNKEKKVTEKSLETQKKILNLDNVDDSETNSHTDESGYSDTMKSTINESVDFMTHNNTPYIPTPPPLDESFFSKPLLQKSYSFTSRAPTIVPVEIEKENEPRVSLQSNGSLDDGHIVFGSDKQMNFMLKLNTIFQSKMLNDGDTEKRHRSHSTGNVIDNTELRSFERPSIFTDLKKELLSKEASQNLRPVNTESFKYEKSSNYGDNEELTMSREEMKSKLESIFANGGPQLIRPRLVKSKPSTPENSQTDDSSIENISKIPKMEKNDTLKRQKDRFSAVLSSFILNLNKEDEV